MCYPTTKGVATALSVATVCWTSLALAQSQSGPLGDGFDIDRMVPSPAGDRFMYVPEPRVRDQTCEVDRQGAAEPPAGSTYKTLPCYLALKAFSSYQFSPKVYRLAGVNGSKVNTSAVVSRLHLGVSWTPHPILQWSLDLPLQYYQTDLSNTGDYFGAPAGSTQIGRRADFLDIGDVRLGGRLAWAMGATFRWGIQTYLFFPSGDHQLLTGDRTGILPPRFDLLALASIGEHDDAVHPNGSKGSLGVVSAYAGVAGRTALVASDTSLHLGVKGGLAAGLNRIADWRTILPVTELRFEQVMKEPDKRAFLFDASLGLRFILVHPVDPRSHGQDPKGEVQQKSAWITLMGTIGSSFLPNLPMYAVGLDFSIIPWTK